MPSTHNEILLDEGDFGNPDAATANVQKPIHMGRVFPALGVSPGRLSTHLIVGRKGSGKTFHWRTLEAAAKDRNELISITDTTTLQESTVKKISIRAGENSYSDFWSIVWRRAIFSFLSSLFYARHSALPFDVKSRLTPQIEEKLFSNQFESIFRQPLVELTPVGYIEKFAGSNRHVFDTFLNNELWGELEKAILLSIPETSPIYIFIDAIDHQAHTVPQMWHDCQYGLFMTILQMMKETSGRFHVVATIPDSVYRERIVTDHGTKIFSDSHIRVLDWGRRENEYFLKHKIMQTMSIGNKKDMAIDDVIERWIGFRTVFNRRRNVEEAASHYILRHTRCLPRDVVIIGNEISRQRLACARSGRPFTEGYLRKAVEGCSKLFGRELIETCLTELLVSKNSINEYTLILQQDADDLKIFKDSMRAELERFIKSIGKQVFTYQEIEGALQGVFGENSISEEWRDKRYRVDNVFWRNGVIAYLDQRGPDLTKWIYNWYAASEDVNLPTGAPRYGFHPSIADRFMLKIVDGEYVF